MTDLFQSPEIADDVARLNADIIALMQTLPDKWLFSAPELREARKKGTGPFPLNPLSPRAETFKIKGAHAPIGMREIRPQSAPIKGVYLHFHGGGWMLGTNDQMDSVFEDMADMLHMACVSVDYRLAPEHPYPAGADDCEAAALWLVEQAHARYGTRRLFIGGESAGAHLSVVSLLRLRDRHGITPFCASILNAGCFDLQLTPSARLFGETPLILTTRDCCEFIKRFIPPGYALDDADISPLYADLTGLPPSLLSVGTNDALLDDSLFMAQRLKVKGIKAHLEVFPGGCHVFHHFDISIARECREKTFAFLHSFLE